MVAVRVLVVGFSVNAATTIMVMMVMVVNFSATTTIVSLPLIATVIVVTWLVVPSAHLRIGLLGALADHPVVAAIVICYLGLLTDLIDIVAIVHVVFSATLIVNVVVLHIVLLAILRLMLDVVIDDLLLLVAMVVLCRVIHILEVLHFGVWVGILVCVGWSGALMKCCDEAHHD